MANIKVFGCLCYAYNLHYHGDKFASRTRKQGWQWTLDAPQIKGAFYLTYWPWTYWTLSKLKLLNPNWTYWNLLNLIGTYWTWLNLIRMNLLDLIGTYWPYWNLLNLIGPDWNLLDLIGPNWNLFDLIRQKHWPWIT